MSKINWLFGWAKENGIEIPIDYEGRADIEELLEKYKEWCAQNRQKLVESADAVEGINLSRGEYAVLRQEVMRKNSRQKGKVKPNNYAFTSDYFYVYSTSGGDSFVPLKQFEIEKDRDKINDWLELWGEQI